MIRVLIADDQAIIAEALGALLRTEPDMDVVALANSAPEAVRKAAEVHPDVVLMDVQMPGTANCKDGIDATALILAADPAAKIIVLTTFGRPGYLQRAMQAGAVGFMVKDASAERLVDAIRRVSAGVRVVDPTLAAASLSIGPSPLTERETEVLAAASGGRSSAAIAAATFLSEGTVRNHLSAAIGKLGAASRAEAVQIATENGWL